MNLPSWRAAGAALALSLALLAPSGALPARAGTPPAQAPALSSGIDPADLDPAVRPADDFFDYATGGWRKRNPIPGDQARWGTFNVLDDTNTHRLRDLLVEARASQAPEGSLERKLGNFYASGMDEEALEREGLAPLKEDLDAVAAAGSRADLEALIARLHLQGVSPYFNFFASQDDADSTRMIGVAWQGGLGLPERDYYLREDPDSRKLLQAYREHVSRMFALLGDPPEEAAREADAVLRLETKLAKASLPAAELRDPKKVYHLLDLPGLEALTPGFSWPRYLQGMGLAGVRELNAAIPGFLQAVDRELGATPVAEHRSYLRWTLVNQYAPFLSRALEEESFRFRSTVMRGVREMKPRWKRVVDTVDDTVGMGLGELYVKKYFPPEARARVQEMVENLKAALAQDLPTLTWMSEATKKAALEKLGAFRAKIGYPDRWRDYSALRLEERGYLQNVRRARAFEVRRDLAKIGQPVDREEWLMPPQMVNAYYNPSMNEIVFPAGILQPPFFDAGADDAANYGAIGMVIGHEITHGFDDQGAQYDGQGNLRNWWTPEDLENFRKLGEGIEAQFSAYQVAGLHLNGKLVLGESIADLGGLRLAWMAWQRSQEGRTPRLLDGFTPEQRFFLGYARVWAIHMRPEMEKLQVNTDPHPHARWRVNGPLSNLPEFFEAFGVRPGDPMARPEDRRNRIW